MKIKLGLKSSPDPEQFQNRMDYCPEYFEFHLDEAWMHNDWSRQFSYASEVCEQVILHAPLSLTGKPIMLTDTSIIGEKRFLLYKDYITQLLKMCAKVRNNRVLAHMTAMPTCNTSSYQYGIMLQRLHELALLGGNNIIFENTSKGAFSFGTLEGDLNIMRSKVRLAYDISHAFITLNGNNDYLQRSMLRLAPYVDHYHIVDSKGLHHDSLPLGEGLIDWKNIFPCMSPTATYVYEINCRDINKCDEMIASYHKHCEVLGMKVQTKNS